MKRKIFRAVIALIALIGIMLIVIRFLPITYKGLALPRPPNNRDITMPQPAPAWLIVGDEATLASYGSFSLPVLIVGIGHGDAPAPQGRPDLTTAALPAGTQAVIVIASTAIKEFHVTVQPWTESPDSVPPIIRDLKAESRWGINKTVVTLERLSKADDLLLELTVSYLTVSFYQGSASYHWRLNPVPVSTLTAADQLAMATADLQQARTTLTTYFSALHAGRYAEVTKYYGGGYEVLSSWQPNLNPNDHMRLFKNACLSGRLMCLEVRAVVQEEVVSPSEFKFVVEFKNEDGSLFVHSPCCGALETAMPSQFQFPYLVVKAWNDRFLVQGLPVYTP